MTEQDVAGGTSGQEDNFKAQINAHDGGTLNLRKHWALVTATSFP
jgi:hypothetical protein